MNAHGDAVKLRVLAKRHKLVCWPSCRSRGSRQEIVLQTHVLPTHYMVDDLQ
jgi:hypothetical protein